jgi:hypothetical protein
MREYILTLMLLIGLYPLLQAQNLEVQGKAKIIDMDLNNSADSLVVVLPDGTLARRDAATLVSGWILNNDSVYTQKHVSIGKSGTSNIFEVFADSLFSTEIIDQVSIATGSPLEINGTQSGAQSFVVDTSGTLVRIEVLANRSAGVISNLQLELRTGNDPTAGVSLATTFFDVTSMTDSVYSIQITSVLPVAKDDTLIMIVSHIGGDPGFWQRQNTSVYAQGNAWSYIDPTWSEELTFDHWFNSFIALEDSAEVSAFTITQDSKVEVAGSISIGDDEDSNPKVGTIRWNDATQDFEGYTGTAWKSLTKDKNVFGNADIMYNSTESNKLTASDAAPVHNFGYSVSISGDYAIIGALFANGNEPNSGSAYVFVRSGTTWIEQAKLTASDGATADAFGFSVSISGDYAIVGANSDDDNGTNSGSAYIFVRSGTTWTEQAKIIGSDAAASNNFGYSVSISGNYAIVGDYQDDVNALNSGAAYIFVRSGTTWTEQAKLTATDFAADDQFGFEVSISGDYAIIGAFQDDDDGLNSGSAYIFVRSGTMWIEQTKLTASDAAAVDYFGISVSISGNNAIVGAYLDDDGGSASGSAYIFVRSGTMWTEQTKLTASDAAVDDNFGRSVCISGDNAIVGSFLNDDGGTASGSAYIFVRSGTTWNEEAKLTSSDAAANDNFGWSVSISGNYAIVGAWKDDDGGSASGSAYMY